MKTDLNKVITIEVKKVGKGNFKYCADRPQFSGAPSVGYGKTCKEAIGDLIYKSSNDFLIELNLPKEELNRIYKEYERNR